MIKCLQPDPDLLLAFQLALSLLNENEFGVTRIRVYRSHKALLPSKDGVQTRPQGYLPGLVSFCTCLHHPGLVPGSNSYCVIPVTTPAPTVLPPSLIAKRSPSSIAIGVISSMFIRILSPGITISTPSGSSMTPVTSVVRK